MGECIDNGTLFVIEEYVIAGIALTLSPNLTRVKPVDLVGDAWPEEVLRGLSGDHLTLGCVCLDYLTSSV